MKPTLALSFAIAALAAAASAAAQTAAPAAPEKSAPPAATPAATPPAGRPLILRLDELDGPRLSVGPSAGEKPPEKDLPALGGKPSKAWERPNQSVFPEDTERKNQGVK